MSNNSTGTRRVFMRRTPLISPEVELYIYTATLIIGVLGNGLVVLSVAARKRRRLTANDIFILNLAVSDLVLLMIFMPFSIYIRVARFTPSLFTCKFTAPIITVALGGVIFTLTAMALQRCCVICYPFRQEMSTKTACWSITFIWVLSVALSIPKILLAAPVRNTCRILWKSPTQLQTYTVMLFIVRFAIPFCVISLSYLKMAIKLLKSQAPRFTTDTSGNIRNITNRRENIEVVKTLLIISALFLVCMLPYRVSLILIMFGWNKNSDVRNVYTITATLTFIHSCINPIIYGTFMRKFKRDYKRIIVNIVCCKLCGNKVLRETTDRSDRLELEGTKSSNLKSNLDVKSKGEFKTSTNRENVVETACMLDN